jgi:hypothetical protein
MHDLKRGFLPMAAVMVFVGALLLHEPTRRRALVVVILLP